MEKLSKEDIRFIENYLENSGLSYFDIRLEMTDHVASEIETKMHQGDARGFYLIFKEYMLEHKTVLLKNYKKFKWKIVKKMMVKTFHNLYHPKTILISIFVAGIVYFFKGSLQEYSSVFGLIFFLLLVLVALLPYLLVKKKYSYMHLSTLCFVLVDYQMINILFQGKEVSTTVLFWSIVLLAWANIAILKTLFDLNVQYKKQFLLA